MTFAPLIHTVVAMLLWERLKTAWDLAARVQHLEKRMDEVTSEWVDVLDMLRAREERQRKRDQRAVKAHLREPEPEVPAPTLAAKLSKAELWQQARTRGLAPNPPNKEGSA